MPTSPRACGPTRIEPQVSRARSADHHRRQGRAVAGHRGPPAGPAAPGRSRGRGSVRAKAGADPLERLRDMARDGIDGEVDLPQQGPRDVGHARSRVRAWPSAASTTTGRGRLSGPTSTACRRPPPSPPVTSRAPSPRCSAWRGWASAASRCRASRSGAATTSSTPTTTCPCSTRCGRPSRTRTCPSPSTSRRGAIRARRAATAGRSSTTSRTPCRPTIEPVANLCASGVLERFPRPALRHHRGRHRLAALAARRDGRGLPEASLLGAPEAPAAAQRVLPSARLRVVPGGSGRARPRRAPWNLADTLMWGNDYPHHEGTWPHSAEAIERTMGDLTRCLAREGARPQRRAFLRLLGAGGLRRVARARAR